MLVTTVGDELKSASRAAADSPLYPKVFGMSLKDRSAMLPAGHMANAAFWLDTKTGAFVTSTYYRRGPARLGGGIQREEAGRRLCRKDVDLSRSRRGQRGRPCLRPGAPLYSAVSAARLATICLLSFAVTAIEAEHLGQRGVTDLL